MSYFNTIAITAVASQYNDSYEIHTILLIYNIINSTYAIYIINIHLNDRNVSFIVQHRLRYIATGHLRFK